MMWHRPASIFTCAIAGALLVFLAGDGASSSAAQPGRTTIGPAPPSFIRLAAPASGDATAGDPQAAVEEGLLVGDLPSEGGIGLALWSGGAASALAEAARDLGCNVAAVYANHPSGGMIRYLPTALQLPNSEFHAAYPNGLSPSSPVAVECAAPGAPRIAFLGDVPDDRQWELRTEIGRVQTFFNERYGVRVPDFSVYLAPEFSIDLAAAWPRNNLRHTVYRENRPGQDFDSQALAHQTADGELLVFISGSYLYEGFGEMFAYTYFHLLQTHLRGGRAAAAWNAVPWWLMKGSAAYAGNLYDPTRKPSERVVLEGTYKVTDQLVKLERKRYWDDYLQAATAFELLVDWYGEETSYIEYWRRLADDTWQNAFELIFGTSFKSFQNRYTEYRNSVYGRIHVTLRGLKNAGLNAEESLYCPETDGRKYCFVQGGVTLQAEGDEFVYWVSVSIDDSDDGVASIRVPGGGYTIVLGSSIVVGGTTIGYPVYYNSETGALELQCGSRQSATRIEVENGTDITLSIDTPRFYLFQGTVLYADGAPVPDSGAEVEAHGLSPEPCGGSTHSTGGPGGHGEGSIYIRASDGSSFALRVTAGGRDFGWWNGDGFTDDRAQAETLTLRGADLTGVEIRLPATPGGK